MSPCVCRLAVAALTLGGCHDDDGESTVRCGESQISVDGACVSETCGSGPWGEIPLDDAVAFVDAAAAFRGTGSQEAPFQTIKEGLALAEGAGGGRVVVAAGTYAEDLALGAQDNGVTLSGRCADLVTLSGSGDGPALAVEASSDLGMAPALAISGFTITNGVPGVRVRYSNAELQDLNIVHPTGAGVAALGSHLTLRRVTVTGTQLGLGAGFSEDSITAQAIVATVSTVVAEDIAVSDSAWYGVFLEQCDTTWTGGRITGTGRPDDLEQADGAALMVTYGSFDASDLVISDNVGRGIAVFNAEAKVSGLLVSGTSVGRLKNGTGVQVGRVSAGADLAVVTLSQCEIEDNGGVGLNVHYGTLNLEDCTVSSRLGIDGAHGYGAYVGDKSELNATNVNFEDCFDAGVILDESTGVLDNVSIHGTQRDSEGAIAAGVVVQDNATLRALDLVVSQTEGVGLVSRLFADASCERCELSGSGFAGAVSHNATLRLTDTVLSDSAPDANLGGGVGVAAFADSFLGSLVLRGVTIRESALAAVYVEGSGTYRVTDSDLEGGVDLSSSTVFPWGNAVFATGGVDVWMDGAGLKLSGNTLHDSPGGAVFLDGSSALLDGNTYSDNSIDLVQDRCAGVTTPIGAEEAGTIDLCPSYDARVEPLSFYLYLPNLVIDE